jgi:AraC-like DNA-binding protein
MSRKSQHASVSDCECVPSGHIGADVSCCIGDILDAKKCKPTIITVATMLSMNVRTLQRHLGEHGLTFRILLDKYRRECAIRKLSDGSQSISEIATDLGYSDPSHFSRAFLRWTGRSPSQFCGASRQ